MASTGSIDGWPLGPTGLRVLLRLPTQASSSYTELKSSCARHDVRIHISSYLLNLMTVAFSVNLMSLFSLTKQWKPSCKLAVMM